MLHHEERGAWRKDIAPYEKPQFKRSLWQMINTLVPFFALWYLSYLSLSVSYLLSLALAVPAGGFLVRTFIIFHDCCHRSFFRNKTANAVIGTLTGILTCCPYSQWRHSHSVHHATNGNLNKRGTGDIWTLTTDEYLSSPRATRLAYRLYRNPLVMFGLGAVWIFLVDYRFNRKGADAKERFNTYLTNFGIVALAGILCLTIGWKAFLLIQIPVFFTASVAGVWLFYIQHTFEDSYFQKEEHWDYVKAAMHGSSFYKLPKALQWISGNIGYHHIHHLSPRVPNYFLQKAHDKNASLQDVPTITLLTSFKSLAYRIWDEQSNKFVSFRGMKKLSRLRKASK